MTVAASLQAETENRGVVLDPRTKLLLLMTVALFVLGGGVQGASNAVLQPVLAAVPVALLLSARRIHMAAGYVVAYALSYTMLLAVTPHLTGVLNFAVMGSASLFTRFMPSVMIGIYLLTTTTVSEFTAAMQRMHLSEKVIIPLSVMFRFFPTLADECASINAAMRMRGVSFAGGNPVAMLEYRIVPMLMCSAKIGEELSAAALTRGLGGEVQRTNVCEVGFRVADVVVLILCVVPYVLFLAQRTGVIA